MMQRHGCGFGRLGLLSAASLATWAGCFPASAQEPSASGTIDEVIVTATKRAEPLQDVPISLTAFTEETFQQLRPDNLGDLSTRVPNMYFPPAEESATQYITLRGLGPGVTRSSGRSVGVYIDGVYTSADNLTNLPVTDLASVEVLRGPQGTLFGRDTIGGAINVTTHKPGEVFSGFGELEYGSYDRFVAQAGVDVPLADSLFFRLSARQLNYGGHIDNLYTGKKADGLDQFSGRAQLYYRPNDRFDARLIYTRSDRDDHPTTGENAEGTFADQIPHRVNINVRESFVQDADSLALSMNYQFDSGHTLTSITGWSRSDDHSLVDRDLTPEHISTQAISYDVKDFTQEIRLASPSDGRFEYLVGLYYLESDVTNRDTYPVFGAAWLANLGFPPILPDVLDGQERVIDSRSWAVFSQATYNFTDRFSVFGGLRYTNDRKEVRHSTFGEVFGALGFISAEIVGEADDDPVTWSLGLRYAFSDQLKTYASVSTGYRSASLKDDFLTAADLLNPAGNVTKPEYATNYEIGAKFRSAGGRVSANAAIFYMDYTDIQVSVSVPPMLFVRQLENAASAHIQGFELDGSIALTDNLVFSGGVGYVETEYDEFRPSPTLDLSGTGFGNTPEWTINAALDYTYSLTRGNIQLHVDASIVTVPDDFNTNATALQLGDYSMLNGQIAYETADGDWRFALYGQNLLDHDDPLSTTVWGAGLGPNQHTVYVYQPPRTFGVSVRRNF